MNADIQQARIDQLKEQNLKLLRQNQLLARIVRQIPGLLISARLDALEGKETTYDYNRARHALYFHL